MSLYDVARHIDATTATISRIETGRSNLTWSALQAIGEALDVDPYELLFRDPDSGEIEDIVTEIRNATPEMQEQIIRVVRALMGNK